MTRIPPSSATGHRYAVTTTTAHFQSRACGTGPDRLTEFLAVGMQAQIKLEAFGFAIADATKALELDADYVKVN